MELALGTVCRSHLAEHGRVLAEVDGHPVEAGADPDDLAGGAELVELLGPVVRYASREDIRLPKRDWKRESLQRNQRFPERSATPHPVPARQEASERRLLRGLDLLPQRSERGTAQPPQDVGVTPFALGPARPQLAADEQLLPLELVKDCFDVDPEALPRLGGRERPASLGVAQHESAERLLASFEIDIGQARRRHDTERIAVAAGVLRGDQALLARDPHPQRPPLGFEHGSLRLVELADAEIPPQPQQIVQLVGIPRVAAQLRLHLLDRVRVEQLAQLLLPQQLPQQLAVERQRLRPPLGRRRVVLVHVSGDVVEEQRGRIGRRGRRLDVDEVELPRPQSLQQPLQRRQVEDVLQALAVGLEDDRESRVLPRHLEQRLGLQSLLPERRPLIRSPARDQQRPRGVLAEACAEERRVADFVDDQLLDLLGIDQDEVARRRRVGVGQMDRDPVVRPDRVGVEPERLVNAGREREPPGRVHPGAERRQDAEPPVADLVTETLDHDRPVGRKRARSRSLLAQELEQVLRGALVEGMLLAQLRLRLPVRQSR